MKNKNSKRISIKTMVLASVAIPMLLLGVVITFVSCRMMRTGMENLAYDSLKAVANSAESMLDMITPGDYGMEGEEVTKGGRILSELYHAIDDAASDNDASITIFYGDVRRITTIKDNTGKRIVGTTADPTIAKTVLKGEEYTSAAAVVNGEKYFAYYRPLFNGTEPVGMLFVGKPSEDVSGYIARNRTIIIVIALVVFVIFIISTLKLAMSKIIAPLKQVQTAAQNLAKGDINQHLEKESNDEYGDLIDDFNSIIENIGGQAKVAEKVADGDLTVTVNVSSDVDVMGKSIKKMVYENNKNMSTIRDAASRMSMGANEVASASNALAQGTTQQASAIEEITASIEEIANGAKINADDANTANELAQSTKEGAIKGNEQMKNMIAAMKDINESSENISKIMKVIDDIAFQTNILALNASVEAARAGVHGKGFAVVADEVRNLASKSAEAAKNSAEMIEDSIRKVEVGSKLAEETAAALETILNSVEKIAVLVGNIANASTQQATSVSQVNSGITQIADVVQTNSATSQECAASSTELSSLASQLQHAVGKYRLLVGGESTESFESESYEESYSSTNNDNEKIISLDDDFGKY